jgi:hypothetical protein
LKNEIRIRELRKYDVTYMVSIDQQDKKIRVVFTADDHDIQPGNAVFYRLGNVVRQINAPLIETVISPVDDEDLTDISE